MAETTIKLDYPCEHKKGAMNFVLKEYLLLGAGPVNLSDRVRRIVGSQALIPMSAEMFDMMDDIKAMLQYIFQTKNKLTLAIQASGNGGNETILTNLLDPGDRLVIAIGGTWGEKVLDMALRYNIDVLPLRKPPGEIYTSEELEEAIIRHKAEVLFVTHGESTGGILQKLDQLGPVCRKHGCLLAVDAIVSIAVDPLFVDRWGVDAVSAGSQKAIGAPTGMCMLSFSPRAEERMQRKKTKPPYYFDMERLGTYWDCFDTPREYHYTFSSNLVASVREALAQICEEGLDVMWERHRRTAHLFWKKLDELGLENLIKNIENRFHGVTLVMVPKDINQLEFLAYLKSKHSIEITTGHGPSLNKAMRVGLLGDNSRPEVVEYLCKALKDGLEHFRVSNGVK